MDISGCGRQIVKGAQLDKGQAILSHMERMMSVDKEQSRVYQARWKDNQLDTPNTFIGNKHFWRSDMMVHRRANWYASVKMSSVRVIGAEVCNNENMLGLHLGDGALYVYQTGAEYEDIFPFWDWHRLPGTTCNQSRKKLTPNGWNKSYGFSDFVGGVSDGEFGIAALDYKRGAVAAKKSWFFLDNAIVCLGAGITASQGGTILTSVQQSLLQGDVYTSSGKATKGKASLKVGDWVHHAGIGYHLLEGTSPVLQCIEQEGDWQHVFADHPSAPSSGDVFSLWFDHGTTPTDQRYSYILYPQTSPSDMNRLVKTDITILSNTSELQAIEDPRESRVSAVFYAAGTLNWGNGQSLKTDTPCILTMTSSSNRTRLWISEPTHKFSEIQLTINDKQITIKLPQEGEAGKTKEVL
jgi:chondroitin AC lyase